MTSIYESVQRDLWNEVMEWNCDGKGEPEDWEPDLCLAPIFNDVYDESVLVTFAEFVELMEMFPGITLKVTSSTGE